MILLFLNYYKYVKRNQTILIMVASIIFICLVSIHSWWYGSKGTWTEVQGHEVDMVYWMKGSSKNPVVGRISEGFPRATDSSSSSSKAAGKDSAGELECRRVLAKIFKKPFQKERPAFLNNPVTGGHFNLELDCYESDLKIAVEYNGRQHYDFIPFFHKNKEAFMNQKYRDDMKRRMCKDAGVTLIEVPFSVPIDKIEGFIQGKLGVME